MEMGLHRAGGDPHGRCHLGLGQVEVVAEDERFPLAFRQLPQGVRAPGRAHRRAVPSPPPMAPPSRGRSGGVPVADVLAAQLRPGTVQHGAPQVGRCGIDASQPAEAGVEPDEGILHHFLAATDVAEQQRGERTSER